MPFRRYSGATGGGETGPSGQGDVRRDMAWHCRRLAAGGLPGSPGGDKRGRDTKVSLPLLTPQPFLRTRLPPVARLKARGPQGRLVLQGITLDRSGAFRSANPAPCTVWPRTVMRGGLRKVNSGSDSVPKSARRTDPSPRFPRFAARPKGVAAQRRVLGSQEGAREPYGALAPFCPSPWARRTPPVNTGTSAARRRQCPACPSAANLASTGCAAVSAEGLPSASDKAEKALIACGGTPLYRRKVP